MTANPFGAEGPHGARPGWRQGPDAIHQVWEPAGPAPAWSDGRRLDAQLDTLAGADLSLDVPPAKRAALLRRQAHEIRHLRALAQGSGDIDACRRWTMAIAGHDLRQPLQVLALSLDRLRDRPDRAAALAMVMEAALGHLTLGLDRLAHAAAVPPEAVTPPPAVRVCLSDMLDGVAHRWAPLAAAKGLQLKIYGGDLAVASDPALLGSALDNLVGNAVKYTDAGRVVVAARRRNGGVRLEVVDTGPGFDQSRFEILFEPYRQGDPAAEGLGLGLAIVAQVTRLLGHRLEVRSKTGCGSCFAIEAPLA
jgi:signal transduction histidine kinase